MHLYKLYFSAAWGQGSPQARQCLQMSPGEFLRRDKSKIKPALGTCAICQQVGTCAICAICWHLCNLSTRWGECNYASAAGHRLRNQQDLRLDSLSMFFYVCFLFASLFQKSQSYFLHFSILHHPFEGKLMYSVSCLMTCVC